VAASNPGAIRRTDTNYGKPAGDDGKLKLDGEM
jgi:hypothetical protein